MDRDGADSTLLDLPVDVDLQEFTISISGLRPSIVLTDPDGEYGSLPENKCDQVNNQSNKLTIKYIKKLNKNI